MVQNIGIVKDFYILDSVHHFFWLSSKILHIDFLFFLFCFLRAYTGSQTTFPLDPEVN